VIEIPNGENIAVVPDELIGEHSPAKDVHVEIIKTADTALSEAAEAIERGRQRLQNVLDRYEERASGPK